MSANIKSKYLREFIKEIQYQNRNPQNIKILELLDDLSTNPEKLIFKGTKLYRSRVITDLKKINKTPNFFGYDADNSFIPPVKFTRDMRANYRYIPYLYCASDSYTALVEVRPRLGSSVSIATIVANEDLNLLDFTMQKKPGKMTEAKQNLFFDLSILYSTPVTDDDNILDYIPTQYIAEYAKNLGYDGIIFTSSLTPERNQYSFDFFNAVIFKYEKCSVLKSNVFLITNNYVDCEQIDNDIEKLQIKSNMLRIKD